MHSDPSTAVKFWSTWVGQLAGAPEPASCHADTGGQQCWPQGRASCHPRVVSDTQLLDLRKEFKGL